MGGREYLSIVAICQIYILPFKQNRTKDKGKKTVEQQEGDRY